MAREVAVEAVLVAEEALAAAVALAEAEAALVALVLVLLEQKVTFNNCHYSQPHLLEAPVNTLIRSY